MSLRFRTTAPIDPATRMLAAVLAVDPTAVAFEALTEIEALARASHDVFRAAHIGAGSQPISVRRAGTDLFIGTTGGRYRRVGLTPLELISDLTFLCSLVLDEGQWTTAGSAGAPYEWIWEDTTGGVHRALHFDGTDGRALGRRSDSTAPDHHRFPRCFVGLGATASERLEGEFAGGRFDFRVELPEGMQVRRSFLRLIWPPFHGRGLVASRRSHAWDASSEASGSFVGVRLVRRGCDRDTVLAHRECRRFGHYGRYYAAPLEASHLDLAIATTFDEQGNELDLQLDVTKDACLDICHGSFHVFGWRQGST